MQPRDAQAGKTNGPDPDDTRAIATCRAPRRAMNRSATPEAAPRPRQMRAHPREEPARIWRCSQARSGIDDCWPCGHSAMTTPVIIRKVGCRSRKTAVCRRNRHCGLPDRRTVIQRLNSGTGTALAAAAGERLGGRAGTFVMEMAQLLLDECRRNFNILPIQDLVPCEVSGPLSCAVDPKIA